MEQITVDDTILNYQFFDKNTDPIILIHGFCETSEIWMEMVETCSSSLYMINLPGFGGSDAPKKYSLEYLASLIHKMILKLEIERYILVGHSLGGYIITSYMKLYQNHAAGYGMIHSKAGNDSDIKKAERNKSIKFIKSTGAEVFINLFFKNLFISNTGFTNILINKLSYQAMATKEEVIISYIEMMRDREDNSAILKTITSPILYVVGVFDKILDFDQQLDEVSECQVSQLNIMRISSHMSMFEEPQKFCESLKRFNEYVGYFKK